MPNIIQHKRSSTSGVVPAATGLSQGELAINIADGKFYTKNNTNTIINLGVTSISGTYITPASGSFNTVIFNNAGDPSLSARQLAWNNSEGSLALGVSDTHAIFIGEEMLYRVRNNTGSSLLAGTPVYASGITVGSNRIEVSPHVADGNVREVRFMGLMMEDCSAGINGYATHFGYIKNIDTRGDATTNGTTNKLWTTGEPYWTEGDILYVHPTVTGKLTKIEPKHSISVAIILNRHQNQGKLFVRPTSYGHLNDNHDVNVSGATNGQFLQYNSSTDYWVPSSSGNFTSLSVNSTGVSISGHTHTSSNITDFNSSVSGLLPVKNIIAGSGMSVSSTSGNFTITANVIDCGIIGSGYTPPPLGQSLPFSVVLTSGISYSIPAGCSSMKIWAIGGGGNGGNTGEGCSGGGGGAGGCAFKTWASPNGTISMSIGGPAQATTVSYSAQTITANAGSNGQDGRYDPGIENNYSGQGGDGGTHSGGDGGANGSRGYGRLNWNCDSTGRGGGGIGGAYTGNTTLSLTGQSATDISGLLSALTQANNTSIPFNTTVSAGTSASTFGGGGAGGSTTSGGRGYFGGGGGGASSTNGTLGGVGGSGVVVISFS
jgi:hypothetical protein